MIQQDTGYPLIFRFDELVDPKTCSAIYEYVLSKKNEAKEVDNDKLPWHQSDTIAYNNIDNQEIKEKVKEIKYNVSNLATSCFKQPCFPHFSDLVFWREGKKMWWHKDNGYDWDKDTLKPRVFSCVCYINDNYEGGETLIKHGEEIYTSKPKQGSVVLFTSDERCEHRVTEVKNGNRLTLAMWLAVEEKYKERD